MLKPLQNYIIVQEECNNVSKSGIVIHKMMDDQLIRAKIISVSSKTARSIPELKVGATILFRPYNCYRMRIEGTPSLIVDINDVICVVVEQEEG